MLSLTVIRHFIYNEPCCLCGTYLRGQGPTCSVCWEQLLERFQSAAPERREQDIAVSLFNWIPGDGAKISRLVRHLKGDHQASEWRWIARAWLGQGVWPSHRKSARAKALVLVPMPSPTGRLHALHFARGFAEELGAEVCDYLRLDGAPAHAEQKNLRRWSRRRRRLRCREDITLSELKAKTIVLIDDVVTTGSTVRAARQALRLDQAEVWCLADRRHLAASP